jgi:hypothetical protein
MEVQQYYPKATDGAYDMLSIRPKSQGKLAFDGVENASWILKSIGCTSNDEY